MGVLDFYGNGPGDDEVYEARAVTKGGKNKRREQEEEEASGPNRYYVNPNMMAKKHRDQDGDGVE